MYNKTFWQDHVTQYEDRFKEVNNADGTVTHEPIEGEIIQQGTAQNAENFNNIEYGIFGAHEIGSEAIRSIMHVNQVIKKLTGEVIQTTLTNSLEYPFNNSKKTIALLASRDTMDYTVDIEAVAIGGGSVGKVIITEKQLNGFKIEHTGGAKTVSVKCIVKGGAY